MAINHRRDATKGESKLRGIAGWTLFGIILTYFLIVAIVGAITV